MRESNPGIIKGLVDDSPPVSRSEKIGFAVVLVALIATTYIWPHGW